MAVQPQGSVRKNIALKLKDQSSSFGTVDSPAATKDADAVAQRDYSDMKWDHPIRLCGRGIKDPLLHICEICSLPILIYGRMKRCRHAFCRDCAKKAGGVCPKCKEGEQTFEEASMGNVHICTHAGGRYDNTGCGRSYLSQRDLEAHRLYRHTKDKGLGQAAIPPHLTAPPPQAALPGFSLPPFFQAGMLPPRLPPGFPTSLPPPSAAALGVLLRGVPRAGGPTLMPPPPPPSFSASLAPHSSVISATDPPPKVGVTYLPVFKQ